MKVRAIKRRLSRVMSTLFMTPWHWHNTEDIMWDRIAPVGREFGSPEIDRLMEKDAAAFAVFGTMELVKRWSDTPNDSLGALAPEYEARTPDGLAKIMNLLKAVG